VPILTDEQSHDIFAPTEHGQLAQGPGLQKRRYKLSNDSKTGATYENSNWLAHKASRFMCNTLIENFNVQSPGLSIQLQVQ
jgi:hypothetical protein